MADIQRPVAGGTARIDIHDDQNVLDALHATGKARVDVVRAYLHEHLGPGKQGALRLGSLPLTVGCSVLEE